jgi:hypothetical protein
MEVSSTAGKLAHGQTGVEFRFYERAEYGQLSDEQKAELREHRLSRTNKKGDKVTKTPGNKKWDKSMKKLIAAAVNKKYEKKLQDEQSGVDDDAKVRSYIMSLMSGDMATDKGKATAKASASTATATKVSVSIPTLNSILRRAKHGDRSS